MAQPWEQVALDPAFRALPRDAQKAQLTRGSPWFAKMGEQEQDAFLTERVPASYSAPEGQLARAFASGVQGSAAALDHTAANTLDLVADWTGDPGFIRSAEQHIRKRSEMLAGLSQENAPQDWLGKVVQVAGALPLGVGTAAAAAAIAGPIAGFAGLGYMAARDQGTGEALKRAAIDASIGALFPITQAMSRPSRMAILGLASGALSDQEGVDRVIEAATMGGLGGIAKRAPRAIPADFVHPQLAQRYRAAASAAKFVESGGAADLALELQGGRPTEATHPIGLWVKATTPDGAESYDFHRGVSSDHALARARRAWPGSTVEAVEAPTGADGQPIRATARGELDSAETPRIDPKSISPADEARRLLEEPQISAARGEAALSIDEQLRRLSLEHGIAFARMRGGEWKVNSATDQVSTLLELTRLGGELAYFHGQKVEVPAKARKNALEFAKWAETQRVRLLPGAAAARRLFGADKPAAPGEFRPLSDEVRARVRGEFDSENPADDGAGLRGAARPLPNGDVEAFHVTDDPSKLFGVLDDHTGLDTLEGGGLSVSGNPSLWASQSRGKWSFLESIWGDEGARTRLASALRSTMQFRGLKFDARHDVGTLIDRFEAGEGNPLDLATLRQQGLSTDFSSPEFLTPLAIEPGRSPQIIPVQARGKFAQIEGELAPEHARELRDAGYDGAWLEGPGQQAQLTIWNRHALRRVGEWRPDPDSKAVRFQYDADGEIIGERGQIAEARDVPSEDVGGAPREERPAPTDVQRGWEPISNAGAGSSYVPMYDVEPNTHMPPSVVRKGDVLARLLRAFKAPATFGTTANMRWKPKSPLGYHRYGGAGTGEMRVRKWYDLQVTPHEFSHHLSEHYMNSQSAARNATPPVPFMPKGQDLIPHVWRDPAIGVATNMRWVYRKGLVGWVPLAMSPAEKAMVMGDVVIQRLENAGFGHVAEIQKLSYDVNQTEEGGAEFMRVWMNDRAKLTETVNGTPRAQRALTQFEAAVAGLPAAQRKALLRAQDDIHTWRTQGAAAAAAGNFGIDKSTSDVMHGALDLAREAIFDKFHGILNYVRSSGAESADSADKAFRNLAGVSRIIEMTMTHGLPRSEVDPRDPSRTRWMPHGKSGMDIWAPISSTRAELRRFGLWITGRRANELAGQSIDVKTGRIHQIVNMGAVMPQGIDVRSREKLFSRNQIDSMLAGADKELIQVPGEKGMRPRDQVYEEVFKDLKKWNSDLLDFAQKAGILSAETRANWEKWDLEFVFSFARAFDKNRQVGGGSNALDRALNIPMLKGSSRNLKDEPFKLWADTTAKFIRAVLENEAKVKLFEIMESPRSTFPGRFMVPIPKAKVMERVPVEPLIDAFAKEYEGITGIKFDRQHYKNIFSASDVNALSIFMGADRPFGDHILTVMRRGEPEYAEILDAQLLRGIQALRSPEMGIPMKIANAVRGLRQGAVTIDPGFTLANFAGDTLMSYVMRRHAGPHISAAFKGMRDRFNNDPMYLEMIYNGGGGATLRGMHGFQMKDVTRHAQQMGHDPRGYLNMFNPLEMIRAFQALGRVVEEGPRLAEHRRAREGGVSAAGGSNAAREVSTDFSGEGSNQIVQFFSRTVPFLRATLNGADRFYRAVARDPSDKVNTMMKMGLVMAFSAGLHALNRSYFNDEYEKEPDYRRNNYWLFYLPREWVGAMNPQFPNDHYIHLQYPKRWEPGTASALLERTLDSMLGSEDPLEKTLAQHFLQLTAANFGMHLGNDAFPLPLPVGFDALIEQYSNKVLFTGSPIVPPGLEDLDAWRQVRANQPQIFRKWGELLKDAPSLPDWVRSPARVEALMRGLFGEVSMYVADSIDRLGLDPEGPARGGPFRPLWRRFRAEEPYDKNVDLFYEHLEEFRKVRSTIRDLEKGREREVAKEMLQDPEQRMMAQLSIPYDRANYTAQSINKHMRNIEAGLIETDKTPQEKKVILRHLRDDRSRVMTQMNDYARRKLTEAAQQVKHGS